MTFPQLTFQSLLFPLETFYGINMALVIYGVLLPLRAPCFYLKTGFPFSPLLRGQFLPRQEASKDILRQACLSLKWGKQDTPTSRASSTVSSNSTWQLNKVLDMFGPQTSRKVKCWWTRLSQSEPKRLQDVQGGHQVYLCSCVWIKGLSLTRVWVWKTHFSEAHPKMLPCVGSAKQVSAHPSSLKGVLWSCLQWESYLQLKEGNTHTH